MLLIILLGCKSTIETPPTNTEFIDLVNYVDPFIGTGGVGYEVGCSYPGAARPFGMVKLSPDTSDEFGFAAGFYRGGGYHYDDVHIEGFSHLHLQGTGLTDYGIIASMPVTGLSEDMLNRAGYRQVFSHETETASPGYYGVELPSAYVDLTVTQRTGFSQYTFSPENTDPHVLLDLGHGLGNGRVLSAEASYLAQENAWSGKVHYEGEMSEPFWMHFYLRFETPPENWGYWENGAFIEQPISIQDNDGVNAGLWFQFPVNGVAKMQLALSAVDQEGARNNWLAEHRGWQINDVRDEAYDDWQGLFERIRVSGGTEQNKTRFASALYRTMLMPNLFSDADGRYLGFDGNVRRNLAHDFYTDFSLWDSYRTTHPLYTLLVPDIHRDLLWSLARMTIEGGGLPRWPLGSTDAETMLGTPVNIVLGEAYAKGLRGFDEAAFTRVSVDMVLGYEEPLFGSAPDPVNYAELGYYPMEEVGRSVAWLQESSVADYGLHHLANDFATESTAEILKERGSWFTRAYDPEQGFFVGVREDGSFSTLVSESAWDELYAEGNARQYLWMAPHHPELLIETLGGGERVVSRLDEMFEGAVREDGDYLGLPKPWYWHGNEPSLHVPWLYAIAGEPELTDKWVQWALESQYSNASDGLPGNDDGGTMSAWAVLASIGIYPIVGSNRYVLTPPVFSHVEIDNGLGTIKIEHEKGSQRLLWLNNVKSDISVVEHPDLQNLHWLSPLAP